MKINKFIKNEELKITEDDIDLDGLRAEFLKGYEKSSEVQAKIDNAVADAKKVATEELSSLQAKYDVIEKDNIALKENISNVTLEREIIKAKFPTEKVSEVAKLRNTLYAEEKDTEKALSKIAEDFGGTYFPKTEKTEIPKEPIIASSNGKTEEIKVNRKTNIKDILIKK